MKIVAKKNFETQTDAIAVCCDNVEFSLSSFTNWCPVCEQPYNLFGQALNRDYRSWGEETGEHWSDCV